MGSSNSTGPSEGLGRGAGRQGTPEPTKFTKKAQIHPNELGPGDIVGTLPGEEGSPTGEAMLPVGAPSRSQLQALAEKVDNEVLPAEYRQQVKAYMGLLQGSTSTESEMKQK